MNVLSGTYIFYADVYFIQNFIIKIAVLYLALYCNRLYHQVDTVKGIAKIVYASALGTMVEIVGLVFGNSYNLFILLVHVLEIPLMFWGILRCEKQQMFRVIITGYFFVMVINSLVECLWNWFGQNAGYILLLVFACGIVIVSVRIWQNYKKLQKGIYPVQLFHGEKSIASYGFYDSGNQLTDPYTGKGVHIVSEQLVKKLGLEKEKTVFVPYQALGNEDGIIEVYYVDELVIEGEKQRIRRWKCPIGVTEEKLFKESKYEIIINEEVF